MKPVIIITIAFVLVIPVNVFATTHPDDTFQIAGRTLTHSPTLCAFEPETNIKDAWKKLSSYTRGAITDWEHKLSGSGRVQDNWKIDYQNISIDKQYEELNCDITIQYLPKPENKNEEFQVAGVTYRDGFDNQNIIIYYLNIELERVDSTTPVNEEGYYYYVVEWIPHYTDYLTPGEPLKMTIKHELGHAFGLGHYISENQDRLQRWEAGSERPPSLMIPMKPTKVISADITILDIEKVKEIYGSDGFQSLTFGEELKSEVIFLPNWIKNNAKWWSDDAISDDDFASGIQYMIKNKIIQVGVTSGTSFSVENIIPDWVKQNASWWADGLIQDEDFVTGIQYLVQHGIIRV